MNIWKKSLPDILAILLFAVIAFAYFFPSNIDGRILYREDHAAGRGAGQEATEYYQRTGERTRWTNALFSGMPTYQTAPSYDSAKPLSWLANVYRLFLPGEMGYVFLYLLGFYILLRAFDFRQSLAALGSVIWAFSSYFLIIITAGHIWKVMALAYLPPMIAGIVLAFRGKYLWGLVVLALFTALEINANHVQMTYYYLFIILCMVIGFLVDALRKKQMAHFLKASAVCVVAAVIGLSLNLSNLYHTWEYSKETMRGKSELVKADAGNQTGSGLDRDYITQWSYGIGETWTLLIPNAKGGSSSIQLGSHEKAMEKCDPQVASLCAQWYQYWGEQPGTSGPVYVGAFVLMLFIFGLFIVKGSIKWALLAATVLSILLSWGRNFMGFTDFFIDYVPMYAKFRTVASILVIAEFTIPLLAMLALKRIVEEPEVLAKSRKALIASLVVTAGACLVFALMPTAFFDFVSEADRSNLLRAGAPADALSVYTDNFAKVREVIFTADCWRSLFVILLGTACLWLYKAKKIKATVMIAAVFAICLVDMWQVDKRYLNDSMFVNKSVRDTPVEPTLTEQQILKDTSLDYRVLNFATNTFNENETSYFLKSVGGYHAAKLRRYQELIEAHIQPEMQQTGGTIVKANGDMTQINGDSIFPVLNMLNAKYFIFPAAANGQTLPILNPYTYGNAWFVDKLDYVDNANEELDYLGHHNLRHEAVADKKFKEELGEAVVQDSTSTVTITAYEPNKLSYDVNSTKGGVIVFSEIYYPEWTATVDGKEVPVGRVNYVLRAINVSPGQHKVELSFFPKSIDTTDNIAYAGYCVLLVVLLLIAYLGWKKRKQA